MTRRSHRFTAAIAATCLAGGVAAVVSGGASAQTPQPAPKSQTPPAVVDTDDPQGRASMSSPYIPGVPHVPADVLLALGPDGKASYVGPEGSMYNGPVDEVDARVDAWWAKQMAAGVAPETADEILANPSS